MLSDIGSADFGSMARQAAAAAGVPAYLYQHGGSADLDTPSLMPWVRGVDHLLGLRRGDSGRPRGDSAVVGPPRRRAARSRFGDSRRAGGEGAHARHRRLRVELMAGDPRPLVLYAPTHFATTFRAVEPTGRSSHRPLLRANSANSVLVHAGSQCASSSRTLSSNDAMRVMPEFIRRTVPDAIVTTTALRDLMWAVDGIVVDHVITAACEVPLTDRPCVF